MLDASDRIAVLARSSVYMTEPVGELLDQRDFYNAAIRIETALEPHDLLAAAKSVERELGRDGDGPRHGPRPIDVDLLLVGEIELTDRALRLPHAELTTRRFVIAPLLELDPDLRLPDGTSLSGCLDALAAGQSVERIDDL